MSYPQVIGLYSPSMGSGKSTVSKFLIEDHGYTVVKFAGALKRMTEAFLSELGISQDDLPRYIEGDLKENEIEGLPHVSPRRIMQTLGYEWGQEYINPQVWVLIALRKISSVLSSGGRVVVDDLRYPHEFNALSSLGSILVCINRPEVTRNESHRSEGLLRDYPFTRIISNSGPLGALRKQVSSWFNV